MKFKLLIISLLSAVCASASGSVSTGLCHGIALPGADRFNRVRTTSKGTNDVISSGSAQAPARISATGSNLFGYCVYTASGGNIGWQEITMNGRPRTIWTDWNGSGSPTMKAGWMRDGRVCGISSMEVFGMVLSYSYQEVDATTGSIIVNRPIDISPSNLSGYFTCATYCPEDGRVYGYGLSADGRAHVFKSADARLNEFRIIRIIEDSAQCSSLTWNASEGKLAGINNVGQLVEISRTDGSQKVLMEVDVPDWKPYLTGLVFSPNDDCYLWNANTYANGVEGSYIYALETSARRNVLLHTFDNAEEFSFMVTTDVAVSDEAPGRPAFVSSSFTGASLTGTLRFIMPDKLRDGTSLAGKSIAWTAAVDGKKVSEGTAVGGTQVAVEFKNVEQGLRVFTLTPSYSGKQGLPAAWCAWVGNDHPAMPLDVVLDDTHLSWKAVTTGEHAGYVDAASMQYDVYLNDTFQGTTSSTSYTVKYPEGTAVANYRAKVVARCAGLESQPGYSNAVIKGDALTLPMTIAPTQEQTGLVQYADADGDGRGWSVAEYDERPVFMSAITMEGNANDWLFMPKFAVTDKSAVFSVSINAALVDAGFPDGRLRIALGTEASPAGMTRVIASDIKLASQSFTTLTYLFTIPEDMRSSDQFFIGINATTPDKTIYAAYVRDIKVEATDFTPDAPMAISGASATPAPQGGLSASIAVRIPSVTVGGDTIPASEIMEVTAKGKYTASATGHPGEEVKINIPTVQGVNKISIYASRKVDLKIIDGTEEYVEVYTGVGVPGMVGSLQGNVTADNMGVELRWTAPDGPIKGDWLDYSTLVYSLYTVGTSSWVPVQEIGSGIFSYIYRMPEGSKLQNKYFGIVCSNEAGMAEELRALQFEVGVPLRLPLSENFAGGKANLEPLTYATSSAYSAGRWMISDPKVYKDFMANESGVALIGYPSRKDSKGKVSLPKFSTLKMADATLAISAWTGEQAQKIEVWGECFGMEEPVKVGDILPGGEGWKSFSFELPESLLGKDWVSLSLTVDYASTSDCVAVESYSLTTVSGIGNVESSDLSVMPGEGRITFAGKGRVEVYALSGVALFSGEADGILALPLAKGVYLVRFGASTAKVAIR